MKTYKHTVINNEIQEKMMKEIMETLGYNLQEIWRFQLVEMYNKIKNKPHE